MAKLTPDFSTLVYCTFLGGSGNDYGSGIALDSAGNVYLTGNTSSPDFPTANPLQPSLRGDNNAFVTVLSEDGSSLLYSTYLGGDFGEAFGAGIAVDSAGYVYITGATNSATFPTRNALQPKYGGGGWDAFIVKLTPDGTAPLYSTFLGGRGRDRGASIALDSAGYVYVTGNSASPDFPTVNALQPAYGGGGTGFGDAFVAKLAPDGSALVFSTYLGGSGDEFGFGIAVDGEGNAYVTGITQSPDFPTVNALQPTLRGIQNAFMAKLTADGSTLVYSTYLGGSGGEQGIGIAVDGAGNAYVTGNTNSPDFPTSNALQPAYGGDNSNFNFAGDAFVAELAPDGSALVFSTYLGGSGADFGAGIAVDATGSVYVTGFTTSADFQAVNALQPGYAGGNNYGDAFVAKISP